MKYVIVVGKFDLREDFSGKRNPNVQDLSNKQLVSNHSLVDIIDC